MMLVAVVLFWQQILSHSSTMQLLSVTCSTIKDENVRKLQAEAWDLRELPRSFLPCASPLPSSLLLLFIHFEGLKWYCGDFFFFKYLVPKFRNISHFCLNLSRWCRASWILSETLLRARAYLLSSPLSSPAFRERPSPSYSTTTVTSPSIIRRCCPPPSPEQPSTSPASRSTVWMVSSQQAPLRVSGTVFVISGLIYSRLF